MAVLHGRFPSFHSTATKASIAVYVDMKLSAKGWASYHSAQGRSGGTCVTHIVGSGQLTGKAAEDGYLPLGYALNAYPAVMPQDDFWSRPTIRC